MVLINQKLPLDEREDPRIPNRKKKRLKKGYAIYQAALKFTIANASFEDEPRLVHVAKTMAAAERWIEDQCRRHSWWKKEHYTIIYKG